MALARKYPHAGREGVWQWVFPATRTFVTPKAGERSGLSSELERDEFVALL